MRGLTYGTYPEVLYSMPYNGAAIANTTSRTLLTTTSAGTSSEPFKLPPTFWDPARPAGQAFKVDACGFISTTSTPTFTFAAALDTTQGTFGTNLASTGAYTTGSGLSSALIKAEFICTVQGLGSSGTLTVAGTLTTGGAGNATTSAATVYAIGTSGDVAINTTVDNYLELWGTWGTASSSNTVTLFSFLVTALN